MSFLNKSTDLRFLQRRSKTESPGLPRQYFTKTSGHCGAALDMGDGPD